MEFCEENNAGSDEQDDFERIITPEELIALAQQITEKPGDWTAHLASRLNVPMGFAVFETQDEFWRNWAIVTGLPVPRELYFSDLDDDPYSCPC